MTEWKQIKIPKKLKERLRERKIHRNQPYWEVIQELLEKKEKKED